MKLPRLFATAAALALCTGCNSLDNPLADFPLLHTGRDARTFNPQTGQYEWPNGTAPRPQTRAARSSAAATPAPKDDGRTYDPQRGGWSDPQ